jgi:hypothetical protein
MNRMGKGLMALLEEQKEGRPGLQSAGDQKDRGDDSRFNDTTEAVTMPISIDVKLECLMESVNLHGDVSFCTDHYRSAVIEYLSGNAGIDSLIIAACALQQEIIREAVTRSSVVLHYAVDIAHELGQEARK